MTKKRMWLTGVAATAGVATIWLVVPQLVANATPAAEPEPAVECTLSVAGTSDVPLKNGTETVDASLEVMPTVASCVDRRGDEATNKIMGAVVEVPEKGKLTGNCDSWTAMVTANFTWIYAGPTAQPEVSTIEISGGMANQQAQGTIKVIDGLLKDYTVTPKALSDEALAATAGLLAEACGTEQGATNVVAGFVMAFDKPTATPPEPGNPEPGNPEPGNPEPGTPDPAGNLDPSDPGNLTP